MTRTVAIRGMAWDHPRAVQPLEAISAWWSEGRNVRVTWEARSLKDFEDQPLEELANAFDLVLIDYPFVGTAATSGLIDPVDDWVDEAYLQDQARHSTGPSFASYTWAEKQWALAIDAACQVSAVRVDLLAGTGVGDRPGTWDEVARLARALRAAKSRVAIPLVANHAYSAFLSVGLALAGPDFWPRGERIDRQAGEESLRYLKSIAPDLHPASAEEDPIATSERMADTSEVAYVPLMFGYSSYARDGFRRHRLAFGNAPLGPGGARGSVLGGVGLALSARSLHPVEAADLARTIGSPDMQSGLYVDSGGQPGHAAAWDSDNANAQTGGFFRDTRATMEQAFVRPRVPGHRPFQPAAGKVIHRFLWHDDGGPGSCMRAIARLHDEHLSDWSETGHRGAA